MKQRVYYGPWLAAAILVVGGGLAWKFYPRAAPAPVAPATSVAPQRAAPAPAPVEPAMHYPIEQVPVLPVADATPLPPLDASDTEALAALQAVLGTDPVSQFLVGEFVIPRLVATIDNLPGKTLTRQIYAGQPTAGDLVVSEANGQRWLDDANAARYEPAVRVFESLDARQLVSAYVRFYPLIQKSYRDLGKPEGEFNDRLVAVIDHLLAAPERSGPLELRPIPGRPRLAFADPAMESASVGHKALLRLDPDQALRVKARLRELRGLVAGQRPAG